MQQMTISAELRHGDPSGGRFCMQVSYLGNWLHQDLHPCKPESDPSDSLETLQCMAAWQPETSGFQFKMKKVMRIFDIFHLKSWISEVKACMVLTLLCADPPLPHHPSFLPGPTLHLPNPRLAAESFGCVKTLKNVSRFQWRSSMMKT